jgi:hypothetical protein
MYAILLCVFAFGPTPNAVEQREVEYFEYNHFYDDCARLVFDQLILWGAYPGDDEKRIRDWYLIKGPQDVPRCNPDGSYSVLHFHDDVLYNVRAGYMVETWTQYDPELADRAFVQKPDRIKVFQLGPYAKNYVGTVIGQ